MSACHPTMRWRETDLYCSRWFGNGLGTDSGELMDLDRGGALEILAGNPTIQMPCGLAARFSSKLPAIHDLRRPSVRESADLASNAGSLALSPSWRSAQSPLGWHLCGWLRESG